MDGQPGEEDFEDRRMKARERLNSLLGSDSDVPGERRTWFEQVYDLAEGDPAAVPWADLEPKPALLEWLAVNPGNGARAIDIACGLGDNAQALAAHGYRTTAFDLAHGAIEWARRRFPDSEVDYCVGNLFNLPTKWKGAFDLVHEYYTVQALRGELRQSAFAAIGELIAPGGKLFVVCRSREDDQDAEGPPWPLSPSELSAFETVGLERISLRRFSNEHPGRSVPHLESVYRKPVE